MADLPITRRKLEEARFFLAHMEDYAIQAAHRALTEQDWKVFGFYLSAFLSAGISVTDVLENERQDLYRRLAGWRTALPPQDLALWDFIRDRRSHEVHHKGAKISPGTMLVPVTTTGGGFPVVMWQILYGSQGTPERSMMAPSFAVPKGAPLREVFPTCRRYVELLDAFLSACESSGP